MMGVYKDKSTTKGNRKPWIADVTMRHPSGRELRRKKRARTQAEANEAERALESQLRKELYTPELIEKPKAPKLKDFLPEFLKWYATKQKVSTVYAREHTINKYVLPFFGETRLSEIGAPQCEAFKSFIQETGDCEGLSMNPTLSALNLILKRAKALGLVDALPTIEQVKGSPKEAASLTEQDFDSLLRALPSPQWRAALLLAGVCGLRRGELSALRYQDIDFTKKLIHVKRSLWHKTEGTPKNGEARWVPMTDEVVEALQKLPRKEGKVCEGLPLTRLKRILQKNQINGKNWHTLRHTALTRLGNAGTPIHTLAKIAGHKQLSTTQIYLHTDQAELLAAAERLNQLPTRSGPRTLEGVEVLTAEGFAEGRNKRLEKNELASANPHLERLSEESPSQPQEALSSLLSSLGASCPVLLSSRGPVSPPGLFTGEALSYVALELAELREMGGAL